MYLSEPTTLKHNKWEINVFSEKRQDMLYFVFIVDVKTQNT